MLSGATNMPSGDDGGSLPELLTPILAGDLPKQPIEVGA